MLFMVSCTSDNDIQPVKVKRTVFVYMTAENSLTSKISGDIKEMTDGAVSIPANNRMLIFVDKADSQITPFIAQVTTNKQQPLDTLYKYPHDFYSSDADRETVAMPSTGWAMCRSLNNVP